MPRGGARVGAGRKPIAKRRRAIPTNVVPIEGGRANELSRTPPADLPEDQHAFWRMYAPLAMDAGTLTRQTEGAFRLLCELDAEKRATRETIAKDGRTTMGITTDVTSSEQHVQIKAHPLTSAYRQLAQRVETLMGRFALAPFGKPLEGQRKKGPMTTSPWLAIAQPRKTPGA
jgi:terminase small subunit-like protein